MDGVRSFGISTQVDWLTPQEKGILIGLATYGQTVFDTSTSMSAAYPVVPPTEVAADGTDVEVAQALETIVNGDCASVVVLENED
jgi:hypothetical protein